MWNEYLHVVSDPAHILAEVTFIIVVDGLLLGLAIPFVRRAIRRHDATHHQED